MAGESRPVPADLLVAPSVAATVAALELTDADAAAVKLAGRLAEEIDTQTRLADGDPSVIERLAGRLLGVLEALGATPRARAAAAKGGASSATPAPVSPLAKMRDAR